MMYKGNKKMKKLDKIEILANGVIQVREIELFELADGTTREGGYHRVVYTPDMDIETIEYDRCKALATAVWTQEVIQEYKDSIKPLEEV